MGIAIAVKHMFAAGMTNEQVMAYIEEEEEDKTAIEAERAIDDAPESCDCPDCNRRERDRIRQSRYRATKRDSGVTKRDNSVTVTLKEAPHTPQENNYIYNKPKNEKRGSRLPSDWKPSSESLSYAQKLGFSASDIDGMAEDMRLWAASASGQIAVKRDWESAFKGWCRRERNKRGPVAGHYRGKNVVVGSFRKELAPEKVIEFTPEEKARRLALVDQLKQSLKQMPKGR